MKFRKRSIGLLAFGLAQFAAVGAYAQLPDDMPLPSQERPQAMITKYPGASAKWTLIFDARWCPENQREVRFLAATDMNFAHDVEAMYCGSTRMLYTGRIEFTAFQSRVTRGKVLDSGNVVRYDLFETAFNPRSTEELNGNMFWIRERYPRKDIVVDNFRVPTPADIANLYAQYHAEFNSWTSAQTKISGESAISAPLLGVMIYLRRNISNVRCTPIRSGATNCSYSTRFETIPNASLSALALALTDPITTSTTTDTFTRSGAGWRSETLRTWAQKVAAESRNSGGGYASQSDDGAERRSKCLSNAWQDQTMAICF